MLVSVGHLMHLVNDMNVPAHVRNDAHPLGDPLEVWMRGGWDGSDASQGFHVMGSSVTGFTPGSASLPPHPDLETFMKTEADFTSRHFFSNDTLEKSDEYYPAQSTVSYTEYVDMGNNVKKRYVKNSQGTKIAIEIESRLCNNLRKLYYGDNPSRRGIGLCGAPTSIQGDDSVLEESGKALIPRAIANAAGFLNYFFRGQMTGALSQDGLTIVNSSDVSSVDNSNAVTFQRCGMLYVYYDNSQGERKLLVSRKLIKRLHAGESTYVPMHITREIYSAMPKDAKVLTVVYDGKIGAEKGVSVCRIGVGENDVDDDAPKDKNAVDMYLNWDHECDIDMNLELTGPNVKYAVQDIYGYGKEHAYVESEFDMQPGDLYMFGATGRQFEESTLQEIDLLNNPISVRAFLETPTGSYIRVWNIENFANLDIGQFGDMKVEENTTVITDSNSSSSGGGGVIRTYSCSEEDKKETCGCVNCAYVVTGMKRRVENGPIAGADVSIIRIEEAEESNPNIVFTTKTTDKEDIFESGMIELSDAAKGRIDIDAYYLVSASGGYDIDRDDDMHRDMEPTKNNGTIHAIIKGEDLILMPFRVNILTEAIYQVSGDVIGGNYDKEALERKLDDAAQRLITQKLYVKDDNQTIRYADVLLWTPALDKKALYKPFEIYAAPIIEKLYADKERHKESYALIYEPYESDAPQLKPLALSIPQGLPNGTVIAKVTTLNQKPFKEVVIEGNYHDHFSVDVDGSVSIAQSSVIRAGNRYALRMYAIGEDDKKGISVSLNIEVGGTYSVTHPDRSVPMFVSATVYTIEENSPEGTAVADVSFNDSNATIVGYRLSGENATDFEIDDHGHVSVAQDARIDYERSRVYRFSVVARNDAGNESYPVSIEIPIRNVIDTPIFDQVVFEYIEENSRVGSVVTTIRQDRKGLGNIEKFEILSPNIPFGIDSDGTIRITQPIDYEQKRSYNFYAVAVTPYGNSNKIEINIVVNDQEPEVGIPHVQEGVVVSVAENTPSGSKIAEIAIDRGSDPIERIAWFGTGKEFFRIDENGSIYLQDGYHLDYETTPRYDLGIRALNARGWSNEGHVVIDVMNVPDTAPVLRSSRLQIEENTSVGTVAGEIAVMDPGEGNITGFVLHGDGAEKFTVDMHGAVKLVEEIDYEQKTNYTLEVKAQSTAGESKVVRLNIEVIDVGTPPILADANFTFSLIERSPDYGESVGRVQIVNDGDSPIRSIMLEGNGSEYFAVDAEGNVTISQPFDTDARDLFVLKAKAENKFGTSKPIDVNISLEPKSVDAGDTMLVAANEAFSLNGTVDEKYRTLIKQITWSSPDTDKISCVDNNRTECEVPEGLRIGEYMAEFTVEYVGGYVQSDSQRIIVVRDPLDNVLSMIEQPLTGLEQMKLSKDKTKIYAAGDFEGNDLFKIIDVSDPANMHIIASYAYGDDSASYVTLDINEDETKAVITASGHTIVLDISDDTNIQKISSRYSYWTQYAYGAAWYQDNRIVVNNWHNWNEYSSILLVDADTMEVNRTVVKNDKWINAIEVFSEKKLLIYPNGSANVLFDLGQNKIVYELNVSRHPNYVSDENKTHILFNGIKKVYDPVWNEYETKDYKGVLDVTDLEYISVQEVGKKFNIVYRDQGYSIENNVVGLVESGWIYSTIKKLDFSNMDHQYIENILPIKGQVDFIVEDEGKSVVYVYSSDGMRAISTKHQSVSAKFIFKGLGYDVFAANKNYLYGTTNGYNTTSKITDLKDIYHPIRVGEFEIRKHCYPDCGIETPTIVSIAYAKIIDNQLYMVSSPDYWTFDLNDKNQTFYLELPSKYDDAYQIGDEFAISQDKIYIYAPYSKTEQNQILQGISVLSTETKEQKDVSFGSGYSSFEHITLDNEEEYLYALFEGDIYVFEVKEMVNISKVAKIDTKKAEHFIVSSDKLYVYTESSIKIFDVQTKNKIRELVSVPLLSSMLQWNKVISLSPDGNRLVINTKYGVRIYPVDTNGMIDRNDFEDIYFPDNYVDISNIVWIDNITFSAGDYIVELREK